MRLTYDQMIILAPKRCLKSNIRDDINDFVYNIYHSNVIIIASAFLYSYFELFGFLIISFFNFLPRKNNIINALEYHGSINLNGFSQVRNHHCPTHIINLGKTSTAGRTGRGIGKGKFWFIFVILLFVFHPRIYAGHHRNNSLRLP